MKAQFLTRPADSFPDRFSLVEALLWQGDYPLLELHLDRLEDSADYFGFPCDRAAVRAALLAHAAPYAQMAGSRAAQSPKTSRKVRLLLDPDGVLHIASELLPGVTFPAHAKPLRVRIARQRTDPQDPMLFHKTTHRPVYAEAFKAATEAAFDDALFLNQRGEVTESAIGNILVLKDGRWYTPPVECGLLAGVYRRHLLETIGVQEQVLHLQDLRQADAVYLSNAVRGLRPAIIQWENLPSATA